MSEISSMDCIPPLAVVHNATRGLMLRAQYKRGSTPIGMEIGLRLSARTPLDARTITRMYSYFARHLIDKKGRDFYNPDRPSNGAIAWLIWGGDAGADWSYMIYKQMKNKDNNKKTTHRYISG